MVTIWPDTSPIESWALYSFPVSLGGLVKKDRGGIMWLLKLDCKNTMYYDLLSWMATSETHALCYEVAQATTWEGHYRYFRWQPRLRSWPKASINCQTQLNKSSDESNYLVTTSLQVFPAEAPDTVEQRQLPLPGPSCVPDLGIREHYKTVVLHHQTLQNVCSTAIIAETPIITQFQQWFRVTPVLLTS